MYQEPQCHYGTEQSHRVRNAQPSHKCRSLKIGFSSENVARKELYKQRNRGCGVQRCYLCDECKHWHLTSQEDNQYDSKGRTVTDTKKLNKKYLRGSTKKGNKHRQEHRNACDKAIIDWQRGE